MKRIAPSAEDLSRDLLDTGMEATMLAAEAQMVIAYRAGQMCGLAPVIGGEFHRMIAEKTPAFLAALLAAGLTAVGGQRPDQVVAAALHPLRTETNRNLRRLGGEEHL